MTNLKIYAQKKFERLFAFVLAKIPIHDTIFLGTKKSDVKSLEVIKLMQRNMTAKWSNIADSITTYVLSRRKKNPTADNENYIGVYNDWIHSSAIEIHDAELSYWCLHHIEYLYKLPLSMLRECI